MTYDSSKIILTPNGYKAGKLYALKGADAILVRAVTATRENSLGITETMGVNVPLIDYSGPGDCPVINVISADTYTIPIPSDANRLTYYNEDGTTTQITVTPSTNYTPVVGRYKAIVVDYGTIPTLPYNFDVEADWASTGITDQESFEDALDVTVGAFAITGNKIEAEILANGTFLVLSNRSITKVNYITKDGFNEIELNENLLTDFNLSKPLPIDLTTVNVKNNLITTAGYTASEAYANLQTPFTNNCQFNFSFNTDSVVGTNFETILTTKNATVNP